MNRRALLQRLGLTMGGLVALPSWANAWSADNLATTTWLSQDQTATLSFAVDTLLPATDTPGAKELGVPAFVALMIQDVHESKDQVIFQNFLQKIDSQCQYIFGKSFAEASEKQRLQILSNLEASDLAEDKRGYGLFKNLTIQGYLTSEYVMTNILPYEFIPSRYHGCVPVTA